VAASRCRAAAPPRITSRARCRGSTWWWCSCCSCGAAASLAQPPQRWDTSWTWLTPFTPFTCPLFVCPSAAWAAPLVLCSAAPMMAREPEAARLPAPPPGAGATLSAEQNGSARGAPACCCCIPPTWRTPPELIRRHSPPCPRPAHATGTRGALTQRLEDPARPTTCSPARISSGLAMALSGRDVSRGRGATRARERLAGAPKSPPKRQHARMLSSQRARGVQAGACWTNAACTADGSRDGPRTAVALGTLHHLSWHLATDRS
jgi:hypothetical protein